MTATTAVPKRRFSVRRRKYDGQCWLITGTSFFEVDEFVERVWTRCDGQASVGAIADALATGTAMDREEAVAATANAVTLLHRLGLVELVQP